MKRVFFGIDTSNYTTSCAAVTDENEIFSEKRHLAVPLGERGTRQSDALFCHTRDLPEIAGKVISRLGEKYPDVKIAGIAVSNAPRREEGSYMPCFLAGMNAAKVSASLLGVPLYEFSHQEGHIRAAIEGTKSTEKPFPEKEVFYSFHLSGGTGELLRTERKDCRFNTKIVSRTLDITLGKFIDRCGVKMGKSFPCGKELDMLALKSKALPKINIKSNKDGINLSGFENMFDKMLLEKKSEEELSGFVFCVAVFAIEKMLSFIPEKERDFPVLFSGGVASSEFIKKHFSGNENLYFAPAGFSADNAIGTALLCKDMGGKND